jgi:pilus assembly protein CpaB
VLRNQVDTQTVVTQGITKNQLFGERSASAKPAPTVIARPRSAAVAAVANKPSTCIEVFQNGLMALKCF